jgi:hypothetical protein
MREREPARAPATRRWLIATVLLGVAACAVDSRNPTARGDDEGFGLGNGGAQSGVTGGTSGTSLPAPSPGGAGGRNGSGIAPESAGGTVGLGSGGAASPDSDGSSAGDGDVPGGGAGGAAAAGTPPAMPAGPCGLRLLAAPLLTFDDLLSTVALDLAALDEDDALNTRYLALTNRQSAGAPTCELDADSRLLLQVLSSLTVDATAPGPTRLGGAPLIYRIDLRALNWNVGVNLRGTDFTDTWEAIAASSPYAVGFVGDDADDAVADSGTQFPVLFVDALLDQMLAGVPPFPPGVLATLRADVELVPSLDRVSAPVEVRDVAGDLGVTDMALRANLNLLDPALAVLGDNRSLERAVYAPLYRSTLCVLSISNENQPDPNLCP